MMLNRLLPVTIDNHYRGHVIALVFFVVISLISTGRSLAHILLADGGVQSIAGIPLDSYPDGAVGSLIVVFGYWGGSQLLFAVLFWIVLWRYRSLIPMMWLFIILEYSIQLGVSATKSVIVSSAPGTIANLIIIPLGIVILLLSLLDTKRQTTHDKL